MKKNLKTKIITKVIIGMLFSTISIICFMSKDTFAAVSDFPSSYQHYLKILQEKYPDWIFEPVNTKLNFETVIDNEMDSLSSGNGNKSLVWKSADNLLKRNEPCDIDKDGNYIYKDSSSWVSASRNTVSWFIDPRHWLNEVNIMMFEDNDFDSKVQTLTGVENILKTTTMNKRNINYYQLTSGKHVDTKEYGKTKTINTSTTYAKAFYDAGKNNKISPYYLASKAVQEIGGNYQNSSVGGKYYSSVNKTYFTALYNFYNVGANDGKDPVYNGLNYANDKGWITPEKAISGGASFFYNNYLSQGQNTGYFVRFNVNPLNDYYLYWHQFMTNISGAAQETSAIYNTYNQLGVLKQKKKFLIPVYEHMPNEANTITINGATNKAKTEYDMNVRSGPGINYSTSGIVKANQSITVIDGERNNIGYSYDSLTYPYWYKINYTQDGKNKTGYVWSEGITFDESLSILKGNTYNLTTTLKYSSDKVYYHSDNPKIATVDSNGKITAKAEGYVSIYAFLGNGKMYARRIYVYGASINYTSKSIDYGKSFELSVTSANYQLKSFTSSNSAIAKISSVNGMKAIIYGQGVGSATITATLSNGQKLTCKVNVDVPQAIISKATVSYNHIRIYWNKVSIADGYNIYRRQYGTSSYSKIATISKNSTTNYIDNTLCGTKYYYRVVAYKNISKTTYNSLYKTKSVYCRPRSCEIKSISVKSDTPTITWGRVSGATGYVIYRKKDNGSYSKLKAIYGEHMVSYKDSKLDKGVYTYIVRAYRKVDGKNIYGYEYNSKTITIK